ncbi:hypothetical protein Tsubulata_001113 [Turnera subulata]|uniref:UBX domain-containing protein n=1 Tax=Turnera subulata TaxID=218843 RepID=A0A9Q0JH45_9ROSI|nr:hypothetical protein Tsubulata_001113 [Turnera subulata]
MEDTIITTERPQNPSLLNPPTRTICHFSQYTCPRCNSRYCSLPCYKSHSIRCTESFMRENVVEEMRHMQSDDQTKRKMIDILKRFHSQEQEEEEDEMDSMDEDDDGGSISFEDLSPEERKRFQRAVASGELSKLIKPWGPWWLKPSAKTITLSKDGTQLVLPLGQPEALSSPEDNDSTDQSSEIPPGPETPLTPLRKLISTEPSPLLAVHLVDIIYSYCFTLRLYNGDWQSDAIGSAAVVLSISSVLGQAAQPETVLEALSYCLERTCSSEYRHMGGLQFGLALVDDVTNLLSLGSPALICMLCDLQRMIQAGEKELKTEKKQRKSRSETRNKLKLAERKVYFIMCWVHEQPGEAWPSLATLVRAEKASAMNYTNNVNHPRTENRKDRKGKKYIAKPTSKAVTASDGAVAITVSRHRVLTCKTTAFYHRSVAQRRNSPTEPRPGSSSRPKLQEAGMGDVTDKLAYFQAVTGLEDPDLCTEILQAHGWDLELAISSFTSNHNHNDADAAVRDNINNDSSHNEQQDDAVPATSSSSTATDTATLSRNNSSGLVANPPPGLAWRVITLPFSIISGGLGLVSGAVGLGLWAAGGILSYSLGMIGIGRGGAAGESSARLVSVSAASREAMEFVAEFEREYGSSGPGFVGEGFMEALQRSRSEYKLLFVYLHSPDHPDTPGFCQRTLCSQLLSAFVNENFVAWGGSIRKSEGFKMSSSLKASRYPFCAVVMPATNQRIALLQQIEGPKSPEEMLMMLQRVLEESAPVLVSARLEAEERRNNMRLREEQDAAYRAALEADQARERQRREEQERLEREAAEAERKRKEEEEARERAAREAAEKEAALARIRQEKALSLGPEPEKGPDVTRVLVRFPAGERKERRFHSTSTIQSLYDYVDSLGCLDVENYSLVSNFPRIVYGSDKLSLTLKESGLHPQASLFVELN